MLRELTTFAQGLIDAGQAGIPQTKDDALDSIITEIYIAIGAFAFLLLLLAGLRYVTSQGEPQKIEQAKNMIIYTLIGVIIAALAATIVNYVLGATT